jgi:hypothetical protein
MKLTWIVCLCALLTQPLFADAGQHLIPAGSLVSCTTGDARISSKTTAVGDPVLCKVERRRGDFALPYGSYLGGEFTEYKDPGHFVGKGWMQLSFDRIYVGNTVLPVDARVVGVPGYKIDAQGRILGKGHAVRDTVLWMIPVLWPIDLLELPRRGPRPTLKEETMVTLRLMQDVEVPDVAEPERDPNGLIKRGENDYPPMPQQEAPPQQAYEQPAPDMGYAPQPEMAYAPPPPMVAPYAYAPMAYPVFPPLVVGIGGYGGYGAYRGYGGYGVRPGVAYGRGVYGARPGMAYAPRAGVYGGYAGRGFAGGMAVRGGMAMRGGMGGGRMR